MTVQRLTLGKTGETLAVNHLKRLGYEILARNYRVRSGEVDIVARDCGTIVFVEVKTRAGTRFGRPAESVTIAKQRKLGMVAQEYLGCHGLHGLPARFDVVGVLFARSAATGAASAKIEVFKDAFELRG